MVEQLACVSKDKNHRKALFHRQHSIHLTPSSLSCMLSSSLHEGTFDHTSTSVPVVCVREGRGEGGREEGGGRGEEGGGHVT